MGWLVAVLVGSLIGVLAELSMRSDLGFVRNAAVGAIGAVLANALLLHLEVHPDDAIGFALAAASGAPVAIGIVRIFRARPIIL